MQQPQPKGFQGAVIGGGICGLVCTIGLIRAGVKVDIFEAAAQYGEVGAGVGLGPNAVRVLQLLGVLDEAVASSKDGGPSLRPMEYRAGTGDYDLVYFYPSQPEDLGWGMHRATLIDVLATFVDASEHAVTHFNKRCISISPSSDNARTVLHFADGTTHETDFVVGADGIKSTVRRFVVGKEAAAKSLAFTNTLAYRGLVDTEVLRRAGVKSQLSRSPISWMGDGKHIITFPIKDARMINIVAFVTNFEVPVGAIRIPDGENWVTRVPQKELLDEFTGWGEDPRKILECMEQPSRWSIHGLYPPLDTYVQGRTALIGDAAHGMLPHLGAGAGQGLEDAYVLSQLLGLPQTNRSNLEAVLQAYDMIRVPRANDVSRRSKIAGDVYEGHGPSGPSSEGRRADLDTMLDDIWHHDIQADVKECLRWLAQTSL